MLKDDGSAMQNAEAGARFRISERLYEARTVLIFGEINMQLAERVSAQLLALASESSEPIQVVINSPGGHVESGDTIYDLLRFIAPSVTVVGTGWVASAGALIFAAAPRERRLALPNTRFLLHEPSGGVGGPASDIEIEAKQILAMRARHHRILADATGQALSQIAHDTERNHWMNAEEAVAYGLVGRVVQKVSDVPR